MVPRLESVRLDIGGDRAIINAMRRETYGYKPSPDLSPFSEEDNAERPT
jgi:hypothetical protein